ncbi:sporulation histidine kinase inhibitor Sda [Alkalihalobacillus sp. LMS6]|nr:MULTISPECIES: sporulation histidine kinase inhibitor Sda [Bacillaceae]UTR07264.1 sporulation histidine kinase inhibitor Sda [Alkalihalobacillus sp. LMS6]
MLQKLSDDLLLETYNRAIHLSLNADFISILKQELQRRGLLKHIHTEKR